MCGHTLKLCMGSMVLVGAAEGFTVRHYMEAAGGGRLDICHLFANQVYTLTL